MLQDLDDWSGVRIATTCEAGLWAVADEKRSMVFDGIMDPRAIVEIDRAPDAGGDRLALSSDGKLLFIGSYERGVLECCDAETGIVLWSTRVAGIVAISFAYSRLVCWVGGSCVVLGASDGRRIASSSALLLPTPSGGLERARDRSFRFLRSCRGLVTVSGIDGRVDILADGHWASWDVTERIYENLRVPRLCISVSFDPMRALVRDRASKSSDEWDIVQWGSGKVVGRCPANNFSVLSSCGGFVLVPGRGVWSVGKSDWHLT